MARSEWDLHDALDIDARSRRLVMTRVRAGRRLSAGTMLGFATTLVLLIAAAALGTQLGRSGDAAASARPLPGAQRLELFASSNGYAWLTMARPAGWHVATKPEPVNARAGGHREVLVSNVAIDDYLTAQPYPLHLDWSRLPREAVAVEIRDVCGGVSCAAAPEETSFPLRWDDATALTVGGAGSPIEVGSGFEARQILLRYFDSGHVLITYVGDRASAQDRELVGAVVASLEPNPLPTTGVVHDDWLALGPISTLGIDQPVFGTLPGHWPTSPASYYAIRSEAGLLSHPMFYQTSPAKWCSLSWDAASGTFNCASGGERWDRYGHALSPKTNDLDRFLTLVKNGNVYLYPGSLNGGPIAPALRTP